MKLFIKIGLLFLSFFGSLRGLPFNFSLGAALDAGTYRPVNFGGFLKLSSIGVF